MICQEIICTLTNIKYIHFKYSKLSLVINHYIDLIYKGWGT